MAEQEQPILVLGAGVNELVAAHLLTRAGRRVLVLDDRTAPEGTETGWIPPRIVRDLALDRHGLRIDHPDPWLSVPLPDGGRLELCHDVAQSVEAIRRVSPRDAAKWPAFCERMARLARLLETVYTAPPPDPMSRELGELAHFAGTVPAAPIYDLAQALENPFVTEHGRLQTLAHPTEGPYRMVAPPVRCPGEDAPARPAPALGEHTETLLRELGYDGARIRSLRDVGVI